MAALVIAEHDIAQLKSNTLNTVAAAARCGGDVHVLVAGHGAAAIATAAAGIAGVKGLLLADGRHLADGLAVNIAEQVRRPATDYTHVLAPATAFGKNILSRVAALLDIAQVSEITGVVSPDTFERPIYAGNVIATVQSSDRIKMLTVRSTGFEAATLGESHAPIDSIPAAADAGISAFVTRELVTSTRPELTAARVTVSGGRGPGSAENSKLLEPLADMLGAAMGA